MYNTAAAPAPVRRGVRYQDHLAQEWLDTQAPCRWKGNVHLEFRYEQFASLEPSGSWKHPDVVQKWLDRIRTGKPIPPLVVCATGRGTWYLHDGNHRYEAIESVLATDSNELVRVAELVPSPGYHFRYVRFREYGTYLLFRDERAGTRNNNLLIEAPKWPTTTLVN